MVIIIQNITTAGPSAYYQEVFCRLIETVSKNEELKDLDWSYDPDPNSLFQGKTGNYEKKMILLFYMLISTVNVKIRLEGTLFRSNIIRNMLKGACYSSSFCSTKMICQMADEIGDEALNQLSMINKDSVTQEKSDFYLLLLNMLKFYNSDKVEDVIINNINNLNSLLSESYSNSYYKMQIYQLLCSRKGKRTPILIGRCYQSKTKK
ncbi:MAG: hypothetical protein IPN15_14680 [Saprospiraceae bacterium]|nr:hypothetical protein [Candidatus Vicinibacter affinis]